MAVDFLVVLDEWMRPGTQVAARVAFSTFGPAKRDDGRGTGGTSGATAASGPYSSWVAYCASVYSSTPPAMRNRWVMDDFSLNGLRAECTASGGGYTWEPSSCDMLFGIPVTVLPGGAGGLPRLE